MKPIGTYQRRKRAFVVQSSIVRTACLLAVFAVGALFATVTRASETFRFDILGDRTGEAVPGVYEEAWTEAAADHPRFVISVGDTIQGESDDTMDEQWQAAMQLLRPFARIPKYFAPGNHDVWDAGSAVAYEKYTHHPLHYSFNYRQAHFTVLNEHQVDPLAPISPDELKFLTADLEAHRSQPLKFVVSHTPFWLLGAVTHDPAAQIQVLAKRFGVQYIIAGHLHQMLHFTNQGVTYLSMPSAGGHLRGAKLYKDGWFFAHTTFDVKGSSVSITIHELNPPHGEGRVTHPEDWGASGLVKSAK